MLRGQKNDTWIEGIRVGTQTGSDRWAHGNAALNALDATPEGVGLSKF